MQLVAALRHWITGIRLYIAIAIALYTLEGWWWAAAAHRGTILYATRLEELYAWAAVFLLGAALSIGPICTVLPRLPGKQVLYDARRLLGVGAAWFVVLHISITYASLFKLANPFTLPGTYQEGFALGIAAALILLAMAFTSFDRAFNAMGVWWFRLHRLVYVAVILSLLHIFLIGSHATHVPQLIILSAASIAILGLHVFVTIKKRHSITKWRALTMFTVSLSLIATLDFGFSQHLGYNPVLGKPRTSAHDMQRMDAMDGMKMENQK